MTSPELSFKSSRQATLIKISTELGDFATKLVEIRAQLDGEGNEPLANFYDDFVNDLTAAEASAKELLAHEADPNLQYSSSQD